MLSHLLKSFYRSYETPSSLCENNSFHKYTTASSHQPPTSVSWEENSTRTRGRGEKATPLVQHDEQGPPRLHRSPRARERLPHSPVWDPWEDGNGSKRHDRPKARHNRFPRGGTGSCQ